VWITSKEIPMSVLTSHADIVFIEEGDCTRAEAVLDLGGMQFYGLGDARRAAGDPDVPIVGEELSASRALSDLAHKLLDAAAARIEKFGD
jgi:uncharacterized protein DUF1876